jgi:citronellol/citronellal dehydrogenase
MDLNGKVAIVTGSSRGLGKAISKTLARVGVKVVLAARTELPHPRIDGTIMKTAEEIIAEGGIALPVKCNVTSDDDISLLVENTLKQFDRIDILVHCAAANFPGGIEATQLAKWDILMGLNFRGLAALVKSILPSMKQQGEGHIINVSPKINHALTEGGTYSLSKQISTLLSLTMAEEFKQYGIAVNTLWPEGSLRTEGMIAMGRINSNNQDPQRFADAVFEIVSKDPKAYTGHTLSDIEILREVGIEDFSKYDLPQLEENS